MISLAISSSCRDIHLPKDGVFLKGKIAAVLFPTIKSGIIGIKVSEDQIISLREVGSYSPKWYIGAYIPWGTT